MLSIVIDFDEKFHSKKFTGERKCGFNEIAYRVVMCFP